MKVKKPHQCKHSAPGKLKMLVMCVDDQYLFYIVQPQQ